MLLFNWICIVVSFVWLHKRHFCFNDCIALHQQIFSPSACDVASPLASFLLRHRFLLPAAFLFHLSAFSTSLLLTLSAALCRVTVALCQCPSVVLLLQSAETNLGHMLNQYTVSLSENSSFMALTQANFWLNHKLPHQIVCSLDASLSPGLAAHREAAHVLMLKLWWYRVMMLLTLTVAADNWDVDEHAGKNPSPHHSITGTLCNHVRCTIKASVF